MREAWLLAGYFLVGLRRILSVFWIRLNKFLSCGDAQIPPTTETRHKVVIIGDGFAEGLGDWVVMGGMAGVNRFIHRHVANEDTIRTRWEVVNRGRSGSTSADWVPDDEGKSFFRKKMLARACADAEIVVVVVGTMDVAQDVVGMPLTAMKKSSLDTFTEEELAETVKNIRSTCEALRGLGKHVAVCNVMTTGALITRRSGTAKRINRQLTLYARGTEKEGAAGTAATGTGRGKGKGKGKGEGGGGVRHPVKLVKMNDPRASRSDGRAFDGLHLNAAGYRAFTATLFETIRPMMVAVEWQGWKSKLMPSQQKGAGTGWQEQGLGAEASGHENAGQRKKAE